MSDNPFVYFDIEVNQEKIGRLVFELFKSKAPLAVDNFYHLCKGDMNKEIDGNTTQLTFKDNFFHRIIKNFMIQAGDIIYGSKKFEKSDNIGRGGCSIYATAEELSKPTSLPCYGYFADENLGEFTEAFYLAMANTGNADSNSSQFFIVTYPSPHLNNKHTIFGKVIHGKSIVRTVEYLRTDSDGFPEQSIRIANCGEWNDSMELPLFNASNNTIGGDIYEEYPGDDTNFDQEDCDKAFAAASIIKDSGSQLFKLKDFQNAYFKYEKSLKYVNEFIPELEVDKENNAKFVDLKIKLYLNLSLVLQNLQKYDEAIEYASYALDIPEIEGKDKAKAFYRRGNAFSTKKRYDEALENYKLCNENNPDDKIVDKKIEDVQNIIEQNKEKIKNNISKFFS